MPTVLSDPSPTLYAVLAIFVAVLAAIWLRNRKRGDLIRLLAGASVLVAVVVIDKLVESPREETARKMREIVAATKEKKADDLMKHLSDSFDWNGMKKDQFKNMVKGVMGRAEFNGVDIDGLTRGDFETIGENKVKIGFDAWPTGYGIAEYRYYCKATFVKDPDGQFRMQSFDLYKKRGDEKPVTPEQLR
jgi:hypothetical protein